MYIKHDYHQVRGDIFEYVSTDHKGQVRVDKHVMSCLAN